MRPAKLTMVLVVSVGLGWTAGTAVAGDAYRSSGSNGAEGGQAMTPPSHAGPDRIQGMIIGIARTSTATILTIRVREANTPTAYSISAANTSRRNSARGSGRRGARASALRRIPPTKTRTRTSFHANDGGSGIFGTIIDR